ncbi:MAG: hypothetical protein KDA77_22720, partial [Planctomycetaceae bacterium]|nr:hypothetical protein [Planctomycetaceae bacterium]
DQQNHSRRRRNTPRIRRRNPPGTMPGSLEVIARPATSAIDVIRYTEDDFNQSQANSLAELPLTREAGRVTWININGVSDTSVLLHLQKRFGLHDLALEDAVTSHQRPKVEVYDDHVFIVLRMFSENSVHSEQLSIFLGPQFVITLQESPGDCLDPVRQRLKKGWGKIRAAPADYLA